MDNNAGYLSVLNNFFESNGIGRFNGWTPKIRVQCGRINPAIMGT